MLQFYVPHCICEHVCQIHIYEFISKTKGNVHNMYILSERQWLALGIRGMQLWHVLLFSQYGTIEKKRQQRANSKSTQRNNKFLRT